jgi:hypothetical protein
VDRAELLTERLMEAWRNLGRTHTNFYDTWQFAIEPGFHWKFMTGEEKKAREKFLELESELRRLGYPVPQEYER